MTIAPAPPPKTWIRTTVRAVAQLVSERASPDDRERLLLTFAGLLASGKFSLASGEEAPKSSLLAKAGDLVLTKQGHVEGWVAKKTGMVPVTSEPIQVASTLAVIRPSGALEPRFFAYQWQQLSVYEAIKAELAGRTSAPKDSLEAASVVIAPRTEQLRIVEAIDSYFTRLDDAVETLERVQRNLKRYRASVLKAAVEGRLVPTEAELARAEGRDYEPASVLLERILTERRRRWEEAELAKMQAKGKTPKDDKWKARYVEPVAPDTSALPALPEGWCWASLEQLAYLVRNGYSRKPAIEGAVRILRISAVRPLSVNFEDARWLPGSPEDYSEDLISPGDLLFTRYNGSRSLVGVAGLVRSVDRPTVHPDKLIKVRFLDSVLDLVYVELASNTGASRGFIEKRTRTTAGQAGISGGDIKQLPIPLPPRAEQSKISDEADRLLTLADNARETIVASAQKATRFRQSILKWAFEGRLVDQDPADEPASRLLERIQAERESANGHTPRTARRPRARSHK